jgi:hypothetical protein
LHGDPTAEVRLTSLLSLMSSPVRLRSLYASLVGIVWPRSLCSLCLACLQPSAEPVTSSPYASAVADSNQELLCTYLSGVLLVGLLISAPSAGYRLIPSPAWSSLLSPSRSDSAPGMLMPAMPASPNRSPTATSVMRGLNRDTWYRQEQQEGGRGRHRMFRDRLSARRGLSFVEVAEVRGESATFT